ncbi:hypothetical protein E2C01_028575 [Portunus trituberculatus]|uniref:Uncharacterized protein n=1 Tax=Portunus trituberculatus TaxID=210409 RepID=A0A5B7EPD2_PORTR|nr:hypothetical protein [Portunus trituberculatus]
MECLAQDSGHKATQAMATAMTVAPASVMHLIRQRINSSPNSTFTKDWCSYTQTSDSPLTKTHGDALVQSHPDQ